MIYLYICLLLFISDYTVKIIFTKIKRQQFFKNYAFVDIISTSGKGWCQICTRETTGKFKCANHTDCRYLNCTKTEFYYEKQCCQNLGCLFYHNKHNFIIFPFKSLEFIPYINNRGIPLNSQIDLPVNNQIENSKGNIHRRSRRSHLKGNRHGRMSSGNGTPLLSDLKHQVKHSVNAEGGTSIGYPKNNTPRLNHVTKPIGNTLSNNHRNPSDRITSIKHVYEVYGEQPDIHKKYNKENQSNPDHSLSTHGLPGYFITDTSQIIPKPPRAKYGGASLLFIFIIIITVILCNIAIIIKNSSNIHISKKIFHRKRLPVIKYRSARRVL